MTQFLRDEWALIRLGLTSPLTIWLVAAATVWLLCVPQTMPWAQTVLLLVFAAGLTLMTVTDLAKKEIPLLPIALLAVVGLLFNPGGGPWWFAYAGAATAWVGMLLMGVLAQRMAGRPALGAADVWLAGALGAWLGPLGLAPWLILVALLGILLLLVSRYVFAPSKRRKKDPTMPFGPVLALAAWVALLHGHLYYIWLMLG